MTPWEGWLTDTWEEILEKTEVSESPANNADEPVCLEPNKDLTNWWKGK